MLCVLFPCECVHINASSLHGVEVYLATALWGLRAVLMIRSMPGMPSSSTLYLCLHRPLLLLPTSPSLLRLEIPSEHVRYGDTVLGINMQSSSSYTLIHSVRAKEGCTKTQNAGIAETRIISTQGFKRGQMSCAMVTSKNSFDHVCRWTSLPPKKENSIHMIFLLQGLNMHPSYTCYKDLSVLQNLFLL